MASHHPLEPLASTRAGEKCQYHHFVPRFILKNFSQQKQSKRVQQKGRKKAPVVQSIHLYSIPTGELTTSPVSTSYGVRDLYKDIKNKQNVYQIEKKLAVLEGHAGKSISELLNIVGNQPMGSKSAKFQIKRKYLNYLRKFMFIMFYRKDGYNKTYFNLDDPETSAWIRKFCEQKGLDPSEIWLHVLEYYLDTPHSDLIAQGISAGEELAKVGGIKSLLSLGVDPDLKHFEAAAYGSEAHNFFLVIWEAAEGEEFVISDNSFGLFEGIHSNILPGGVPVPLHRFYVISPKIVLVLCSILLYPGFPLTPELEGVVSGSMLSGAPHIPAKVTDSGGTPASRAGAQDPSIFEEDCMEFEVSRLSTEHTHTVNAIILGNVRNTGIVTFHSKSAALQTLDQFSLNKDFNNQKLYEPLVEQLVKETGQKTHDLKARDAPQEDPYEVIAPEDSSSLGYYEASYQIYLKLQSSTEPMTKPYKEMEQMVIQRMALITRESPGDANPRPARLVRTLDNNSASLLFAVTKGILNKGLGSKRNMIFPEAVSIAFLEWLLENRRGAFDSLERNFGSPLKEYTDGPTPAFAIFMIFGVIAFFALLKFTSKTVLALGTIALFISLKFFSLLS